jgi:hypothetical protein
MRANRPSLVKEGEDEEQEEELERLYSADEYRQERLRSYTLRAQAGLPLFDPRVLRSLPRSSDGR